MGPCHLEVSIYQERSSLGSMSSKMLYVYWLDQRDWHSCWTAVDDGQRETVDANCLREGNDSGPHSTLRRVAAKSVMLVS